MTVEICNTKHQAIEQRLTAIKWMMGLIITAVVLSLGFTAGAYVKTQQLETAGAVRNATLLHISQRLDEMHVDVKKLLQGERK